MHFQILGEITHVETFATGSSIREISRLRKLYGKGRWRKRKGLARVRLTVRMDPCTSLKSTGMKPRASANESSRSNGSLKAS